MDLFIRKFSLTKSKEPVVDDGNEPPPTKKVKKETKNINREKLKPRNIPYERTSKYSNESLEVVDLTNTMNRFRLVGPHSQCILMKTLKISSIQSQNTEENWWNNYYNDENNLKHFEIQNNYWSNFKGDTNNEIIALTIRDPRALLPEKRGVIPDNIDENDQVDEEVRCEISKSPLWESEIRDEVSLNKSSDMEVNNKRSEMLVSGILPLTNDESRIPVIVIQRNTKSNFEVTT